jgi:hypothetical protein
VVFIGKLREEHSLHPTIRPRCGDLKDAGESVLD